MKTNAKFITAGLIAVAGLFFSAASTQAATYHLTLDTSTLAAQLAANGPFSLDFQLNNGDGVVNNSVTLTNFTFGGGSATGSATNLGGASGSLFTSISLTDSGGFSNEFYQSFTPGTTLSFDVSMTFAKAGATPDAFSVAILDKDLMNIPTTGIADSLIVANFTGAPLANNQFNAAAPSGAYAGAAAPTVVPEPSTAAFLGLSLLGLTGFRRRSRQSAVAE